jgi:hypothetical protein
MPRGYDRPLYILPFDHRGSFPHVAAVDTIFCKVLVRHSPEGDRALNQRQCARLKRLQEA